MATTSDPYYDEDSTEQDSTIMVSKLITDDIPGVQDEDHFKRALKQISSTFRKGFCKPEDEMSKSDEESETSHPSNSESDDDSAQAKPRRVTFDEGAEVVVESDLVLESVEVTEVPETAKPALEKPQAVPEVPQDVTDVPKEVALIKTVEKNSDLIVEKPETTSRTLPITIGTIVIVFTAIGLQSHFGGFDKIAEAFFDHEKTRTIMAKIMVEDSLGDPMIKPAMGVTMLSIGALKVGFSTNRKFKALVEFIWGTCVCSAILTGIYLTYS